MKRSNYHHHWALLLLLALLVPIMAACGRITSPATVPTLAAYAGTATPIPRTTAPGSTETIPAVTATRAADGALPGMGKANPADLAPPAQQILRVPLVSDPPSIEVKITLDPRENKTFFDDIRRNTPPLWRGAWISDYPDPYDWDRLVFGPDSDQNFGKWQNDAYTKLLDQADKATDPEKRVMLYKEAEKVLARDVGAIFLFWYGRFRLIKPWVKGLTYTPQDPTIGAYHYKDAQILRH